MTGTWFVGRTLAAIAAFILVAVASAQGAPGPRAPLVPCSPAETGPCVQVATSVADLVGVWKQFLGNPMLEAPGGMAFIRYRPDGTFSIAPTAADTAAPYGRYPRGSITFDGEVATVHVEGDAVPAECRTGTFQIHVLRLGAQKVGLANLVLEDACMGRRADKALPLLWVGE